MGQVYAAEDAELGDTLALKVIHPAFARDRKATRRFKREVQLARQVTHPNVCRIFDLFFHTSRSSAGWGRGERPTLVLTMEMLTGETLARRLKRGALAPAQALALIRQIAGALDAAHRANVVHRDLKSGNVMLERGRDGIRAVVTDFGLAVPADVASRSSSRVALLAAFSGTPEYVAPELLTGEEVTAAADVYSLGVVIYEMLTGTLPFRAATREETARLRLEGTPPSPRRVRPDLPMAWERVILRCLERDPRDRFAAASDIVAALDEPRGPSERDAQKRQAPRSEGRGSGKPAAAPRSAWRGVLRRVAAPIAVLALVAGWQASPWRAAVPAGTAAEPDRPSAEVAAELTLRGRSHWWQRSHKGLYKSVEYFIWALEEDPAYAPAYAGLADAYIQLTVYSHLQPTEAYPRAREALQRALELQPNLAEAHATRGQIALNADWDGPAAEEAYRTAIRLAPDYVPARFWYSELLTFQDRDQEAVAEAERARRLDPRNPLVVTGLALRLLDAGRYQDALPRFREALALDPELYWANGGWGAALEGLGRHREALEARLAAFPPGETELRELYRKGVEESDMRAYGRARLERQERLAKQRWLPAIRFAIAHAEAGHREEAMKYLLLARTETAESLLGADKECFADLADDPRYVALMREIDRRIRPIQAAEAPISETPAAG